MNAMIRYGLLALAMATSGGAWAHAATQDTSERTAAIQHLSNGMGVAKHDRTYAGTFPDLEAQPGNTAEVRPLSAVHAPIQSGNAFNWMEGGGG